MNVFGSQVGTALVLLGKAAVAGLALFVVSLPLEAQEPSAALEGRRVVAVRVVNESGQVLAENATPLALEAGAPYASQTVRESLRLLYGSGRFADVRAEVAEAQGGLRLDFVVRENFYIDVVHVTGLEEPPNETTALASLRLGLGQAYRSSVLHEAVGRLQQTLAGEGLYQARIEPKLSPRPDTRQMDITFQVTPGPRARIARITLHNLTGLPAQADFSDPALLRRSKLKPSDRITAHLLNRGAGRIRKFLVEKGYLGARVAVERGEYSAGSNTLPVALEVSAGPQVRVEVSGAKISSGELRKLLPIYQEAAVDNDLLEEGRRNLRDYLEGKGYFDSVVRYSASTDGDPGRQVIAYQVSQGPRRRLVGIVFEGNHYFGQELLRSRLHIRPAGTFSSGLFSRKLLGADEETIQGLYIANGFLEAQVKGEWIEDYRGKPGDLLVRFQILEGAQTRVAELKVEGNRRLSNEYLLSQAIGSAPGQPYSEFNVASDRDNVLALYFNEGFPQARLESEAVPATAGDPHRVRLTYRIVEGPQVRVERVLLSGYEHTRQSMIAREVQIQPGDPLRAGSLIETQRRLYNLGIFSRVAVAPQNPEGTDPQKTLVVQVEEAKRYTLAYGGGIEVQRLGSSGTNPVNSQVRASPRGLFEITRANFTGRADTISFKVRSSTLQRRALLSYTAPEYFGQRNLSLLLTGFADKTSDVQTFTSTRYEGNAEIAQRLSPATSFLYRYSFRRVLVDASSLRISPDQIPLFSQPTKISGPGVTWIRERRDNPTDAARGDFNTVDLSVAEKALGSTASFVRLFAQNSSFHPLGRTLVFARSTRFGVQTPIGNSLSTEIPLPERFFAGGGNSLRGFGLNQAGPRDPNTGFPVGGQAMLIFNQELRFPMRLPFVGTRLGGAAFYDAGNVFRRLQEITLRTSPPARSPNDPRRGELNYFSHTVGFSLRYATPIGPVRLDLATQLNPAQVFVSCTAGTSGCSSGLRLTRLPRFQLFFNIGSIF